MVDKPSLVAVTATVKLRGLRVGQHALVDPSDPYIAACLEAKILVPRQREASA